MLDLKPFQKYPQLQKSKDSLVQPNILILTYNKNAAIANVKKIRKLTG